MHTVSHTCCLVHEAGQHHNTNWRLSPYVPLSHFAPEVSGSAIRSLLALPNANEDLSFAGFRTAVTKMSHSLTHQPGGPRQCIRAAKHVAGEDCVALGTTRSPWLVGPRLGHLGCPRGLRQGKDSTVLWKTSPHWQPPNYKKVREMFSYCNEWNSWSRVQFLQERKG